jgi:hypothetical protein
MRTPTLLALFLLGGCAASSTALPRAVPLQASAGSSAPSPPMGRPPRPLVDDGIFYVLGEDPAHPRVRYLDGQLALDATCAIQIGNKLSRKVPPCYVNGQPIGFC